MHIEFYKQTSIYTNYYPGWYKQLPNDIYKLTWLVNRQTIHRETLRNSKTLNKEYPWYRYRCEDDILLTAPAMMAELFRLDSRGIVPDREVKNKIVVTCRYVSVLMASILKAKGIPARVRSGFCFIEGRYKEKLLGDHWIVQYYDKNRWINLDTNRIFNLETDYIYHDMPNEWFDFAAEAWLDVRSGRRDIKCFIHGKETQGLCMLARSLFYDFHSLMNDEISYLFFPVFLSDEEKFNRLTDEELSKLDDLARLMLDPDKNFNKLKEIFDTNKQYRCINTPLLGDYDHVELLK